MPITIPSFDITLKRAVWVILIVFFHYVFIDAKIDQFEREAKIKQIVDGEVRGNKGSRIFHVATCPGYEQIDRENLRLFEAISDAEEAGYRAAYNCDDAVSTRRINEEENSVPEHPGEQQYR